MTREELRRHFALEVATICRHGRIRISDEFVQLLAGEMAGRMENWFIARPHPPNGPVDMAAGGPRPEVVTVRVGATQPTTARYRGPTGWRELGSGELADVVRLCCKLPEVEHALVELSFWDRKHKLFDLKMRDA